MKIKYEKPYLEEIELMLEGSFFDANTDPKNPSFGVEEGEGGGGDDGNDNYWN